MPATPSRTRTITLGVNGRAVTRSVDVRMHLADFLREELALTGTHVGCEHGVCGACTVRVDGSVVRGCLVLAAQLDGASVETVEGATANGSLRDLQEAFVSRNALQCGFCTPGMLLCAAEFLDTARTVTRQDIRTAIAGNYCRCTGYEAIVDAIEDVAQARGMKQGWQAAGGRGPPDRCAASPEDAGGPGSPSGRA